MSYKYLGSSSAAPGSGSAAGAGSYLALDANNNLILTSSAGGGGGGTPVGNSGEFQWNDASSFAGSGYLTTDGTGVTGSNLVVSGTTQAVDLAQLDPVFAGYDIAVMGMKLVSSGSLDGAFPTTPGNLGDANSIEFHHGTPASSTRMWAMGSAHAHKSPVVFNSFAMQQRYDLAGVDQDHTFMNVNDDCNITFQTGPSAYVYFNNSGSAGNIQGLKLDLNTDNACHFGNATGNTAFAISGSGSTAAQRRMYFYDLADEWIGGDGDNLTMHAGTEAIVSGTYAVLDSTAGSILKHNGAEKVWIDTSKSPVEFNAPVGDPFGYSASYHAFTGSISHTLKALSFIGGGTASVDAGLSNMFAATITGSQHLANPTNLLPGTSYTFILTQDGTGGRTLSFGTAYKWPGGITGSLSAGANDVDILSAITDGTSLYCSLTKDFS